MPELQELGNCQTDPRGSERVGSEVSRKMNPSPIFASKIDLKSAIRGLLVAITVMLVLLATAVHSAPQAMVKSRWHEIAPLTPNHTGCDFVEDAMLLVIVDGGKELGREDFCAAYGRAKTEVVTDGRGQRYVLVEFGQGRGTNATTTYLSVYRLAINLLEIMRIPLSWSTGPTQRFTYKYTVGSDQLRGLQITLHGTHAMGSVCCLPPEEVQTIRIDGAR